MLAIRNHTTITDLMQINGIDVLDMELNRVTNDFLKVHKNILDSHKGALRRTTEWANQLTEINMELIDRIYNQTVRIDADSDEDAIIRHQIEFPLKSTQVLLSTVANDSRLAAEDPSLYYTRKKEFFLSKLFEIFQYKLKLFNEVLQDFMDILKQNDNSGGADDERHTSDDLNECQQTISTLWHEVNELLAQNDQNRTDNLMNVLFNAWPNLVNVINDTKSHIEYQANQSGGRYVGTSIAQLNRMQNLMKCSEMGADAYRDCRTSVTQLATIVQQVDSTFQKHQSLLKKWTEYAKSVYKNVMGVFGQSGEQQNSILSHLNELNRIFGEMQFNTSACSINFKRAIQDINQAIKLNIDVCNNEQAIADRRSLLDKFEFYSKIQRYRNHETIDAEIQAKMDVFVEILKSNLMLEVCLTTGLQTLKMRTFPFDQDRFILCDLPINTNATSNSGNARQNLGKNIERFKSGDDVHKDYHRQQDEDSISYGPSDSSMLYKWKYNDFKDEIHRLFSGEEIILNVDISNEFDNYFPNYAIKFKKLWFKFKFANNLTQNIFNDFASRYYVKMKMMGRHNYRCDNRFYSVPSVNIDSFFEFQVVGKSGNGVYDKISKKDPFLSPYTLWKISLINERVSDRMSTNPEQFVGDEIELRLFGDVDYVGYYYYEEIPTMCTNEKLNKNYFLEREGSK